MPTKREGRWKCLFCGAENLGRFTSCQFCPAPKGDAKNYLPIGEPAVSDAKLLAMASSAVWMCRFCKESNRLPNTICFKCGALKGTSPINKTRTYSLSNVPRTAQEAADSTVPFNHSPILVTSAGVQEVGSTATFQTSPVPAEVPYQVNEVEEPVDLNRLYRYQGPSRNFDWLHRILKYAVIAGLAAVIGFLIWFFFLKTTEVKAVVNRVEWTRTIFVDRYTTVREENWSIPSGGREVSHTQKVSGYRQVKVGTDHKSRQVENGTREYVCGYEDLGNGFFEDRICSEQLYRTEYYDEDIFESVPIYDTWYTYDIDRWQFYRTVITSGTNQTNPAPYWGNPALNCAEQSIVGCEKQTFTAENYKIIFKTLGDDPQEYTREEDEYDWSSYEFNHQYTLVVNNAKMILNDPLRPDPEKK